MQSRVFDELRKVKTNMKIILQSHAKVIFFAEMRFWQKNVTGILKFYFLQATLCLALLAFFASGNDASSNPSLKIYIGWHSALILVEYDSFSKYKTKCLNSVPTHKYNYSVIRSQCFKFWPGTKCSKRQRNKIFHQRRMEYHWNVNPFHSRLYMTYCCCCWRLLFLFQFRLSRHRGWS